MKQRLTALLLALCTLSALAHDEGGLWLELTGQRNFTKQWHAELSMGHRLEENFAQPARWDIGISTTYKLNRAWRITAGYIYLYDHSAEEAKPNFNSQGLQRGYNIDEPFWRTKHRFHLDLGLKQKIAPRWTLTLRERLQYTRNTAATTMERKLRPVSGGYTGATEQWDGQTYALTARESEDKEAANRLYLRSRVGLEYHRKGSPYTPFVHYEMVNNLREDFDIIRHRIVAGTEYKISKQHSISAAYLFQTGEIESGIIRRLHALNLGYQFKF